LDDLTLEITKKCPMRCILCSSDGGEPYTNEFSLSELQDIIYQAKSLGVTQISLSGGEPLTYPYIFDICKYISDNGIELLVYTSGNMFDENDSISSISIDYFLKLKNAGVKEIIFSTHGSNSEIHDKITATKGSFANLSESIKNSQKAGLKADIHFVPIKENFRDLPLIALWIKNLGLNSLHILRFIPQGRGYTNKDQLALSVDETLELRKILAELISSSDVNVVIGAHYNDLNLSHRKCTAGIEKAVIRPDGLVFPCVGLKGIKSFVDHNDVRKSSLKKIIAQSPGFSISQKSLLTKNCCLVREFTKMGL
jgi:MoaA/NifB/PqqE/SkfB family radical SAM enzyme